VCNFAFPMFYTISLSSLHFTLLLYTFCKVSLSMMILSNNDLQIKYFCFVAIVIGIGMYALLLYQLLLCVVIWWCCEIPCYGATSSR
jgi:hypothetical protein